MLLRGAAVVARDRFAEDAIESATGERPITTFGTLLMASKQQQHIPGHLSWENSSRVNLTDGIPFGFQDRHTGSTSVAFTP